MSQNLTMKNLNGMTSCCYYCEKYCYCCYYCEKYCCYCYCYYEKYRCCYCYGLCLMFRVLRCLHCLYAL